MLRGTAKKKTVSSTAHFPPSSWCPRRTPGDPSPHGASLPTVICLSAQVQPPKKSLFPEMGQASKLGHTPHPTSMHGPSGSSGLRSHRRNPKGPRPFRSFLDFLVEGQVLDSLQTVVEEATERMATVKTEAGVPLVEVEDPMEVPRCGRRARARPILSTVHQRCTRPSLCLGRPNNYPSCSSSMSDSHSSFTANWPGSHSWDSNLGARSLGALPPMKDKLLLEKNLKRLLQLENRRVRSGAAAQVGRGWTPAQSPGPGLAWLPLDASESPPLSAERPRAVLPPRGLPAMGLTGQPDQQPVDPRAAPVLVLRPAGLELRHSRSVRGGASRAGADLPQARAEQGDEVFAEPARVL